MVGQAAEFKFESEFEPLQVIMQTLQGKHSRGLLQEKIKDFHCKSKGQALWAVLWCSLGVSEGQAQAQGIFT